MAILVNGLASRAPISKALEFEIGARAMKKLEKIAIVISSVSTVAGYVALIGMMFLLLVILTEIFLRAFFQVSLEFNITVSMWLLVSVVWMGAAWSLKSGGHIQVSLITSRFSEKAQHWLRMCLGTMGVIFFIFFSLYAWSICSEHYSTGATGQSIWHIPKWYAWVPFCGGSSLLTLQFIGIVFEDIIFLKRLGNGQEGAGK